MEHKAIPFFLVPYYACTIKLLIQSYTRLNRSFTIATFSHISSSQILTPNVISLTAHHSPFTTSRLVNKIKTLNVFLLTQSAPRRNPPFQRLPLYCQTPSVTQPRSQRAPHRGQIHRSQPNRLVSARLRFRSRLLPSRRWFRHRGHRAQCRFLHPRRCSQTRHPRVRLCALFFRARCPRLWRLADARAGAGSQCRATAAGDELQ
jgi:hypothetical protein